MPTSLLRSAACAALTLPQRAAPLKAKKPAVKKNVKKDSGGLPKHLTRYLPFVPTTLVHETTSFLHDATKLRSLLALIFSPCKPEASVSDELASPAARLQFQREKERYHAVRDQHTDWYRRHESAAAAAMWGAIEALPSDLYGEAVQSATFAPPYVNEPPPPDPAESRPPAGKSGAGEADAKSAGSRVRAAGTREDEATQKEGTGFYLERFAFPRALMFHEMYGKQLFQSLSPLERRKLQVFMNLMHVRYPHAELKRDKPGLFWLPERQVLSRQREGAHKRKGAK
ncbi:conserved hypothetical protein [Neospora caninum Liverpool]|uniref:Uncharacterized protein n=1 Tax=Neospora caninum (strain Liverpool) TaxID=572307 RepID=F0VMA2_NEOCL|nr:conserved hypothetical protein [Neospora caninum Liverpool]CBZ54380.1 conserved hypothetical protein [Neospora caninum Liverpool]CEL69087.1 TPA: hypothetical protein BN1204_048100 [Neospora caninum Liverpool]|eukprot:XP_003884410.1 conserved hypothetical protein [Neospora caninum Liverpool]